MRKSCTSIILQEIAFAKVLRRSELNKLCKSTSIVRVILHYLSKLKLVYLTSNGYVVLIPWLMYLKESHGNKWIDAFKGSLEERRIIIRDAELDEIKHLVEDHPIRSLYEFVKVYLRFEDYVDKLKEIPFNAIPDYCKRFDTKWEGPREVYYSCIAPLLSISSWALELLAELIRDLAMYPDPKRVLTTFIEVIKVASSVKDFYTEIIDRLGELVQFVTNIGTTEVEPVEKVVAEYTEKMKISYDERSYIRNLLRYTVLSRL